MKMDEMLHGQQLYCCADEELVNEQIKCMELLYDFNQTRPSQLEERQALLKQMLAEVGEDCYIEPPLHANWGGRHLHFGKGVYANYNLTAVDDTHIYVGDFTMFGPNVVLATPGHPILPKLREKVYQFNLPIHIGRNCWLGAGVVVLPGVSIGDNTVVGAGSVVTKDLPANVVAVGNPCRVLRPIDDRDNIYFAKNRKINWEEIPESDIS